MYVGKHPKEKPKEMVSALRKRTPLRGESIPASSTKIVKYITIGITVLPKVVFSISSSECSYLRAVVSGLPLPTADPLALEFCSYISSKDGLEKTERVNSTVNDNLEKLLGCRLSVNYVETRYICMF